MEKSNPGLRCEILIVVDFSCDLRHERGKDLHGLGAAVRRQRDLLVHLGILHLAVGRRRAELPGGQFNSDSENNSENPSEFLDMSKLEIF